MFDVANSLPTISSRNKLEPSLLLQSTHSYLLRQQQIQRRRTRQKLVQFSKSKSGFGDDDNINVDTSENSSGYAFTDINQPALEESDGISNGYDEMSFAVSPLAYDDGEDDNDAWFPQSSYEDGPNLEDATNRVLDLNCLPLGRLTEIDLQAITGLMAAWARTSSVDGAKTVEVLLKRIVDDRRAGNRKVRPNTRMYTIAINAWARIGHQDVLHCERAQQIHDVMIQTYKETQDPLMRPDTKSYNTLLKAWAKSTDPSAAKKGEKLLQQMLQDKGVCALQPDAQTFGLVLDSYSRVGTAEYVTKAEKLFESMTRLGVQKDVLCYLSLQSVFALSGRIDAAEKCMSILQTMLDRAEQGDVFAQPNRANYNAVLRAYSRTSSKGSAIQAERMLSKMELPVSEGGYDVEPDRFSYVLVILACTRCPDNAVGATLSESVLERMEERARTDKERRDEVSSAAPPLVYMDLECFNLVLTALSKNRVPKAFTRIMKIISRMEKDYAGGGLNHLRPTIRSWIAALNALSRIPTIENGQKAEKIIEQMFKMHENGVPNVKPNGFCYAAVLNTYQKIGTVESAQRADDILSHMERLFEAKSLDEPPDAYHYTIVCSAWGRSASDRGPGRCLEILSHMKTRYKEGVRKAKPTVRTYNAVLDCLSRSLLAERAEQLLYHMMSIAKNGDEDVRPDEYSFDAVINAYVHSNLRDAGMRAESVLERGLEYAEEENGPMLRLSSFTIILGYYARQDKVIDSPYRAEHILNRLISLFLSGHTGLSPHVSCFTSVMDAYEIQSQRNAGENSERLLRNMIKLKNNHGASHLVVNTGLVNRVLKAWVASSAQNKDAAYRAERLLDFMEEKAREGDTSIMPSHKSYNLVLDAWSKSSASEKVFRSYDLLNRILQLQKEGFINDDKSPLTAYCLVVNACAFSHPEDPDQARKILDIAYHVMTEMIQNASDDHKEPTPRAFVWFIQTYVRLQAPEKEKEAHFKYVFSKCCELGRLDSYVLKTLKGATSDDMFARLVSGHLKDKFALGKDSTGRSTPSKETIGISHFRYDCIWNDKRKKEFIGRRRSAISKR